jgi:hypothetical protein
VSGKAHGFSRGMKTNIKINLDIFNLLNVYLK